jgi:hypothetical protein
MSITEKQVASAPTGEFDLQNEEISADAMSTLLIRMQKGELTVTGTSPRMQQRLENAGVK